MSVDFSLFRMNLFLLENWTEAVYTLSQIYVQTNCLFLPRGSSFCSIERTLLELGYQ